MESLYTASAYDCAQVLEAEGDKRSAELQSEGQKIRMRNESEGYLIKVRNEALARKEQLTLEVGSPGGLVPSAHLFLA